MKRALILAFVSTSAIASSNYTQDARDISAAALCGATNVTCQQSYTSGAKDTSAAFKRVLAAYKAIRAAEVPPAPPPSPPAPPPAPVPAPAPAPSPAPPPPPSPPPAVDTTLHPLAFVPSPDVDINTELVPAWGTGAIPPKGFTGATPNLDDPGAFRFVCAPAGLNYDDPIVYPNQPGKSHLHQYYGNTAINAASTYASIRTTGASTCNSPLNRSGYWEPAMLDGKGNVVRPDVNALYYKRYPKTHAYCTVGNPLYQGDCVPIPTGLRMIFGYNMQTMTAGGGYYNCTGPTATQAHYPASQNGLRNAAAICGSGNQLGMIISAPDCWDGIHLDTPDHRSHMSYMKRDPNTGQMKCPATHPKVIPQLTLGVWYSVGPEGATTWSLSSDDMPGMQMTPGSTFHADYFEGWDERVKLMWEDNCINLRLNCSGGDLGNSKQLKMFSGFSIKANPRLVPVPPKP